MRAITAREGGDTDTSRDYEYTDWAKVERFAAGFAETVADHRLRQATDARRQESVRSPYSGTPSTAR
jgi:hypothetical protein